MHGYQMTNTDTVHVLQNVSLYEHFAACTKLVL